MRNYTSIDYARDRLLNTIVRVSGDPAMVTNIYGDNTVEYQDLYDSSYKVAPLGEMDLDPVPLGYVNYKGIATYLSRIPKRQDWKQGLRDGNVRRVGGGIDYPDIKPKALAETILAIYPPYKKVLVALSKLTKKNLFSLAFCRDFCITTDKSLFYKGEFHVGTIGEDGEPEFFDKFDWVADSFNEARLA